MQIGRRVTINCDTVLSSSVIVHDREMRSWCSHHFHVLVISTSTGVAEVLL